MLSIVEIKVDETDIPAPLMRSGVEVVRDLDQTRACIFPIGNRNRSIPPVSCTADGRVYQLVGFLSQSSASTFQVAPLPRYVWRVEKEV
ncbi:hypothetical protein SLE2022_161780 [Rubroshorea leprosula]